MRVLLTIVHYYRPTEASRHSSTDADRRDQRAAALRAVIDSWRGILGPTSLLDIAARRFRRIRGVIDQLDITVLTNGTDHLLDSTYARSRAVRHVAVRLSDPRMLGFAARRLFAEACNAYDLFCYTEDDLRLTDPGFIGKILAFQEAFGWRRLLMPNRFEWNPQGPNLKTWIDGDLRPQATEHWRAQLPDEAFLRLGPTTFQRALNPHSGFYAITAVQLAYWMAQPHWGDDDCSFVSPLESAATLGVLKTFAIYKPFGVDAGFLELEHLDTRFSGIALPRE